MRPKLSVNLITSAVHECAHVFSKQWTEKNLFATKECGVDIELHIVKPNQQYSFSAWLAWF